jgi:hypothetical protein
MKGVSYSHTSYPFYLAIYLSNYVTVRNKQLIQVEGVSYSHTSYPFYLAIYLSNKVTVRNKLTQLIQVDSTFPVIEVYIPIQIPF